LKRRRLFFGFKEKGCFGLEEDEENEWFSDLKRMEKMKHHFLDYHKN